MPKCKFCGKPVRAANVMHAACWETEANKIAGEFCDNYCRFHHECPDEDTLNEQHCSNCALIKVLNLGM